MIRRARARPAMCAVQLRFLSQALQKQRTADVIEFYNKVGGGARAGRGLLTVNQSPKDPQVHQRAVVVG